MQNRPVLVKGLNSTTFREFYYLKEELVTFCREHGLPVSGGKLELSDRIAHFLETGEVMKASKGNKKPAVIGVIERSTKIEPNFVCSEKHRVFFKEQIGGRFSFNVAFQKWLKTNPGRTYEEAITAYHQILKEKKNSKTVIDKQFEYNTYIRDFFADNKGRSLEEAIVCWRYKKQLQGHNRYETFDLVALD